MIPATWDSPDFDQPSAGAPGGAAPTLVSLHFMRAALRRRRVACVLAALLGLLGALAFLSLVPPPHTATTTLVLAHEIQQDPSRAMSTDVSLLTTRTVAQRAIGRLAIAETPDDLLATLTVEPLSSDVMKLTLTAPSDAAAVSRLDAVTAEYLTFRADQLTAQSDFLVQGMKERISALQQQIGALSTRIDKLSASSTASSDALSDAVSDRASLGSQVDSLQQQVQDTTLRTTSIVAASRVIDAAAAEPSSALKHIVLVVGSGLVGGTALGVGTVLFLAITTDRLRRRFEIATALGTPVAVSLGRLAPLPRRLRPLTARLPIDARRATDRRRFAQAVELTLPGPGQPRRLVVACVDGADDVRFGFVIAGLVLGETGQEVTLVDLTTDGVVQPALAALVHTSSGAAPVVLRPLGAPVLARGTDDLRRVGRPDDACAPEDVGPDRVVLVLADLDPATGVPPLVTWADRAVVTVTAGRSSAERVRVAGDLVRDAGLDLRCAVVLRGDRTDDSSGALRGEPATPTGLGAG